MLNAVSHCVTVCALYGSGTTNAVYGCWHVNIDPGLLLLLLQRPCQTPLRCLMSHSMISQVSFPLSLGMMMQPDCTFVVQKLKV